MAVFLRIFSNSLGNVYQKRLTNKGSSPCIINTATYLFLSVCCLPLLFGAGLARMDSVFWLYALLVGLLGALGNGFFLKALECGELSVLAPINSYKAVVALVLGMLFLNETPNVYGLIGMVLIFLGSYFVLGDLKEGFSLKLFQRKDLQYRFAALFFTATEAIFIKKLILLSSISSAFIVWCLFGALFSLVILTFRKIDYSQEAAIFKTRYTSFYINTFICVGLMQYTTNYVFEHLNVAYALALFQLSSLASIFFGYKFFSEKNILKKLIGAVVMIVGALLIILLK